MTYRLSLMLLAAIALGPRPSRADAPSVEHLFPAGAGRGETVEVSASGKLDPWPVNVAVDRPGLDVSAAEEKGTLTVSVAPDAEPGLYWIRLYNDEGAATLRPFVVGTLPEVVENEPNNAIEQATEIEPPGAVANGRLQRSGDVDGYAIPLSKGQTLVASMEANRRLGSPMDGILQVVTSDGFVVDHADDAPLLDPMLQFTAPEDGTYIVRAFAFPEEPSSAIRFAGGDDYIYRLTLTTGGVVDHAVPPAVNRDDSASARVGLFGWNLPEGAAEVPVSIGESKTAHAWHPEVAGTAEVRVVEHPVVVEGQDGAGSLPAVFCGHIGEPEEVDTFEFSASKGQTALFRVEARSIGSPLDPVIRLRDQSGEERSEVDDSGREDRDPVLRFEAPEDGTYRLEVLDLHGRGGPRFVYRIEAGEPSPDFSLSVESDHYEFTPGKALEIEVNVDRGGSGDRDRRRRGRDRDDDDGFNRPISVTATGLPEGVTVEPVVSEPGEDSAGEVTLSLKGGEATSWSGPIRIVGRAGDEGPEHAATADLVGGASTDRLWLTVLAEDGESP